MVIAARRAAFVILPLVALLPVSARGAATDLLPITAQPCSVRGVPRSGPDYFRVRAVPGRAIRLYACLTNRSRHGLTVQLAAVDGRQAGGGTAYALPSAPRRQVGAWLRLSAATIYLRGHDHAILTMMLQPPRHTPPGRYLGALTVALPPHSTRRSSHAALRVQLRLADAVVVTVSPPEHELAP